MDWGTKSFRSLDVWKAMVGLVPLSEVNSLAMKWNVVGYSF